MIDAPKALLERLERIARANHPDDVKAGRRISFAVCRVCGFANWVSSGPVGEGFRVDCDRTVENCERCHEAFARAPEICKWVLGVLSHRDTVRPEPERASGI